MLSSGAAVEVIASPVFVRATLDFQAVPADFAVHFLLIQWRCVGLTLPVLLSAGLDPAAG